MTYTRWGRLGSAAVLGAVALAGLAACGKGESKSAAAESSADEGVVLGAQDVAEARVEEVGGAISLTGSLQPYRRVEILAQVPGTITGVRFDRGQRVSAGTALGSIEADGIRSQAAGAQAAVAAAEAGFAQATRQLESARTLHEAGAMSDLDFRGAETAFEAARAQLAAAKAQAASTGEAARRATVTAPITGVVSERMVESGEAVNPGQKLFVVVNSEHLELAGQIPVEVAGTIKVGQPVSFELQARPGEEYNGTVARIDPVADAGTRQVGVYVRLPNPGTRIIGGQFATGRIQSGEKKQGIVIPAAALREQSGESYVLVVAGSQLERRPVKVGARDEARGVVAILSGLEAGEKVLASPGATLPAGTRVRLEGVKADSVRGEA
jgi:RND family efflux transporter MFP subunit